MKRLQQLKIRLQIVLQVNLLMHKCDNHISKIKQVQEIKK